MDAEIEKLQFRGDPFYKENGIDVLKGIEATAIKTDTKIVTLSTGATLEYDKLYIATGCKPRKINIPGSDLKNVVVLRDYDNAK